MKKIIASFVLVAFLALEANRVWERPPAKVFDEPSDRWCATCLTCDLTEMPPFDVDSARFDTMKAEMYAAVDSVNTEAGEIVADVRFFSVCLTLNGLAMVGIVRYKDGHARTWIAHAAVELRN